MVKVKICGLMEKQHVETAVKNGVDLIGFVFAPSSRRVTKEHAHFLARDVPGHVKKVGVFVNENIETILEIAHFVPLDIIQLHGEESPEQLIQLQNFEIIKAISIYTAKDIQKAQYYELADYFLFDAPGTDYQGGSGNKFDWTLLENHGINRQKTILAGGLNAQNIKIAIEIVQPLIVDVSSGVETDKMKDPKKMKQFIQNAKSGVNTRCQ